MLIGAHIPVAWGYDKAAGYAAEVGCEAVQVFARNPQQWRAKPVDPAAASRFIERRAELGLGPLFTHAAYLINLGSADEELWRRSIETYGDELVRAALLGAVGCITHIGTAYAPGDVEASAARVARAVRLAVEASGGEQGGTLVLLENTAGAGTTFGGSFEELAAVLARTDAAGVDNVGLCLDTCHAWAAGIDVGSPAGWSHALGTIEAMCGKDRIGAVHSNDCKGGRGEHRDRHEWIGDGSIGYTGFEAMLCEPRLARVPALLEMPGELPVKDAENIARLKRLRARCAEAR